jgi:hypothetical protein
MALAGSFQAWWAPVRAVLPSPTGSQMTFAGEPLRLAALIRATNLENLPAPFQSCIRAARTMNLFGAEPT